MTEIRVAYLVKRFPRLSETFVLNEIFEVKRLGVDVVVYAMEDPREPIVNPDAERTRATVVYLHQPGRGFRSWWRLIAGAAMEATGEPRGALRIALALVATHRSLASIRHAVEGMWLARDLRRRGATHLHAHFAHSPAAVAYMAHLASRMPFSFTAHAKDLYTTLPRNLRIRSQAATFVITCTDFNRRHLEGVLAETQHAPVHAIHHGIDLTRFNLAGRDPQPGRVVSVGRLVPKKGYQHLISAFAVLRARGVSFSCEVFGGGSMRDALDRQVRDSGLTGSVHLRGARLQDQIVAAYRTAAVFALAPVVLEDGDRDGIPNVLVEAMACGVPVVSTRISGIPELIEDGVDGLLVDPRDPEALAGAIQRLLEDPVLAARIAVAGRGKVERDFDVAINSRRIVVLFTGLPKPAAAAEAALA